MSVCFIRRTSKNISGSIAPMFGLLLLVLVGAAGLGLDYSYSVNVRSRISQVADAAALAGASGVGITDDVRILVAQKFFDANLLELRSIGDIAPSVTVLNEAETKVVRVQATVDLPTTLLSVLGIDDIRISGTSEAVVGEASSADGTACILTLNSNDDWGIKMGSSSSLVTNCGVYVNNNGDRAITLGSGRLESSFTAVVGEWQERQDFSYSPRPFRAFEGMADPLDHLIAPAYGNCDFQSIRVEDGDTAVLDPGVYCGGLEVKASNLITFRPGIYVIKGGDFKIASHSQVAGDGVFFYMHAGTARIDWGSDARVSFRAPVSGPWMGMLFWANGRPNAPHVFGSHSTSVLQGVVYAPNSKVIIGCSGEVGSEADWTAWIVHSLEIGSSATLRVKTNYATSETPLPDGLIANLHYRAQSVRLR